MDRLQSRRLDTDALLNSERARVQELEEELQRSQVPWPLSSLSGAFS